MSDITGTVSIGDGASIAYDVNPSVPQVEVWLEYAGIKLASATLTEDDATASIGGKAEGVTEKATITANFAAKNVTYEVSVSVPFEKTKDYSGTLVTW